VQDLKRLARDIKRELHASGCEIAHGNCYELIAAYHGYNTYAAMRAGVPAQMTVAKRIAQLDLHDHWELIESTVFKHLQEENEIESAAN
jgi:hypothetical protein